MIDCQVNAPTGSIIVHALKIPTDVWFSLVVPTYNESENAELLVEHLTKALDEKFAGKYEIIFVDDNSPDGTSEVVKALAHRFPQVRLMVRTKERGIASAAVRGWQAARGEVLGLIDGDLQHPVEVLPKLLSNIEKGDEIAVASRYTAHGGVGNWGPYRRFVSRFSAKLSHIIIPEMTKQVNDPGSGCFALRRQVIEERLLQPRGIKTLLEVLVKGQATKISEVPYTFQLRERGETKVSSRLFFEYLTHLFELRLYLWHLDIKQLRTPKKK